MRPVIRRYSREDNLDRRRLIAATVLVVLILIADMVTGGQIRTLVRGAAIRAWSATQGIISWVESTGFIATKHQLAAANTALETRLARYQDQEANVAALQQQNEDLQRLVHLAAARPGITAPVVGAPGTTRYGTFMVGAGAASKVAVSAIVRTDDGFVIGRVSDVQERASTVVELFAPDAQIDVRDASVSFTLHGMGGGNARAEVSRDAAIHEGDVLLAPSLGGAPVAVVGRVESDPAGGSQRVYARVPQSVSSTRYVYIESL